MVRPHEYHERKGTVVCGRCAQGPAVRRPSVLLSPGCSSGDRMSRESKVLEPEVEQKLVAAWPSEEDRAAARAALSRYGVESYERETARVRLAIIKLSGDALGALRRMTDAAKGDYRDVLMWAESPEEAKALWAVNPDLTDEQRHELEAIRRRDRAQMDAWRGKSEK
ncbi:hypothetical protein WME97_32585 [Sorangium sp. So ce367]|uniref:hypothetical protein n=1 Tax=Sorangium sp. So ce367 TaxID=3133305 RepID=UPI003F6035FA